MPYNPQLDDAVRALRGGTGPTSFDQLRAAGRLVLADRERLLRVEVWARKLLDAPDDAEAERARRYLAKALDV
jgi:hypothetical protein